MSKQVVLVTGASQGIGLATAKAFAAAGWSVVMAARGAETLRAEAAALGALAVPCDVTDPEAVEALFDAIAAAHGRLDVVFNNAGASLKSTEPGEVRHEDWRRVLAVNVDGGFLIASGAFRMMKAQRPQGGRIINNGSISSEAPRVGSIAYTASKHAVLGMTRSLALDGRPYDIACGQIDIGNAASDMTASMVTGMPQPDGSVRPEPVMDVRHVADAVVAMAALPLSVNVLRQTIMATKMPLVGRG